jgi:hypothetical protein
MPEYLCKSCLSRIFGWSSNMSCPECGGDLVDVLDIIGEEWSKEGGEQLEFVF